MPFDVLSLRPPAPEPPARLLAPSNNGEVPGLPGDITVFRAKLTGIRNEVGGFRKIMDGLVLGVGADGVISGIPIPYVFDFLSGLTTVWLLSKASQVKMTIGDRLVICGFGAVDVVIGSVLVVGNIGDLFFRAHAWNADRIQRHIDTQLDQIAAVEAQLAQPATAADHHTRLTQLRDGVFRGGKTRKQVWVRMLTIAAACSVLVAYCANQQQLRHERIQACQARDGWFCEWRY